MLVKAKRGGTVTFVDAERIIIDNATSTSCGSSSASTSGPARTRSRSSSSARWSKPDQIIADGASTQEWASSIGKNVLVGFNTFDGYNFEDAIVISERLVKDDVFTSIHIESFDVEIRETKLGREEFTRDIPNVSEKMLRNLDDDGCHPHRRPRRPRRHPRRQGEPEVQERADPGGEAPARDLRSRRRGREERLAGGARRHRGHRDRRQEVQPPHAPHRRAEEEASRRRWSDYERR